MWTNKSSWCFAMKLTDSIPLVSLELSDVHLDYQLNINPASLENVDLELVDFLSHFPVSIIYFTQ